MNLNEMVGVVLARSVGVVVVLEQVGLECGAHHDETDVATLLDGAHEGAEDVRLEGTLVRLIDDDHAVPTMERREGEYWDSALSSMASRRSMPSVMNLM